MRGLEERTVCSGRLKRKRDTLLPLLEHAIASLNEFRVRFNVGVQFLSGVRNRSVNAFEYLPNAGRGASHARLAQSLQFLRARPFRRAEGRGSEVGKTSKRSASYIYRFEGQLLGAAQAYSLTHNHTHKISYVLDFLCLICRSSRQG
jgi:hypothetical protein